jgi:hypothetical protein
MTDGLRLKRTPAWLARAKESDWPQNHSTVSQSWTEAATLYLASASTCCTLFQTPGLVWRLHSSGFIISPSPVRDTPDGLVLSRRLVYLCLPPKGPDQLSRTRVPGLPSCLRTVILNVECDKLSAHAHRRAKDDDGHNRHDSRTRAGFVSNRIRFRHYLWPHRACALDLGASLSLAAFSSTTA